MMTRFNSSGNERVKEYCGTSLRLVKSMYGMTFSGKYWNQELMEHLVQIGAQLLDAYSFVKKIMTQ